MKITIYCLHHNDNVFGIIATVGFIENIKAFFGGNESILQHLSRLKALARTLKRLKENNFTTHGNPIVRTDDTVTAPGELMEKMLRVSALTSSDWFDAHPDRTIGTGKDKVIVNGIICYHYLF